MRTGFWWCITGNSSSPLYKLLSVFFFCPTPRPQSKNLVASCLNKKERNLPPFLDNWDNNVELTEDVNYSRGCWSMELLHMFCYRLTSTIVLCWYLSVLIISDTWVLNMHFRAFFCFKISLSWKSQKMHPFSWIWGGFQAWVELKISFVYCGVA